MMHTFARAAGQREEAARVLARARAEYHAAVVRRDALLAATSPLLVPLLLQRQVEVAAATQRYELACVVARHSGVRLAGFEGALVARRQAASV